MNSSVKRLPVFHLGLGKTGTTTLQRHLFPKHSEIFYLGKSRDHRQRKGCRSEGILEFLRPLLWETNEPMDIEKHRALWSEEVTGTDSDAGRKQIVGSWEGLGDINKKAHRAILERLASALGTYKVIYVLRNPLLRMPSLYLQELRSGYIQKNKPWSDRGFITIDDWFRPRLRRSIVLNYASNIRNAVNLLGNSNVGVFLYEELRKDPKKYYSDMCEFMQIDPQEGLKLAEHAHENFRLSTAQYHFLESGASVLNGDAPDLGSLKSRREQLLSLSGQGKPVKVELSTANQAIVSEQTREGHRWLAESLGLPLADYGYCF